jgi:hypothetical protein
MILILDSKVTDCPHSKTIFRQKPREPSSLDSWRDCGPDSLSQTATQPPTHKTSSLPTYTTFKKPISPKINVA